MKYIFKSDPNWFEKEEAAIDIEGNELRPICCCCSLVEAEVVSSSIFAQVEQFRSDTPAERHLVCASGCQKVSPTDKTARLLAVRTFTSTVYESPRRPLCK